MTTQLEVVNECLAVMGESPIASLDEYHTFRDPALMYLKQANQELQAPGRWFNTENLKLTVDPIDKRIKLPGDFAASITFYHRPDLAVRGNRIYDLVNGTDIFPDSTVLYSRLIRIVPFEDCPMLFAAYVGKEAVTRFQNLYDGDQTKTRNLAAARDQLRAEQEKEHVRNRAVNLFDNSVGVQRIRNVVNRLQRRGLPGHYVR